MSRYIDADKLNKKKKYLFQIQGMPFPKSEWFIKADDLYFAPTADVVEAVRCKDCIHKQNAKINSKGFLICPVSGMEITDDDFCSYGERRWKNDL